MTTMTDEWNAYKQAVYGGELHPQKDKECNQAFFAGMLSLEKQLDEIASLPPQQAVDSLKLLASAMREIKSASVLKT